MQSNESFLKLINGAHELVRYVEEEAEDLRHICQNGDMYCDCEGCKRQRLALGEDDESKDGSNYLVLDKPKSGPIVTPYALLLGFMIGFSLATLIFLIFHIIWKLPS